MIPSPVAMTRALCPRNGRFASPAVHRIQVSAFKPDSFTSSLPCPFTSHHHHTLDFSGTDGYT